MKPPFPANLISKAPGVSVILPTIVFPFGVTKKKRVCTILIVCGHAINDAMANGWIGNDLPLIKSIPTGSYDHDLLSTKIMLMLSKQYNCEFTSERELRYLRAQDGIHIPDGELLLNDKKLLLKWN